STCDSSSRSLKILQRWKRCEARIRSLLFRSAAADNFACEPIQCVKIAIPPRKLMRCIDNCANVARRLPNHVKGLLFERSSVTLVSPASRDGTEERPGSIVRV